MSLWTNLFWNCSIDVSVTLATCGSLASTVSDSENNDDAFFGPIANWFVLINKSFDIGRQPYLLISISIIPLLISIIHLLQNKTDSKH